MQLRYDEDFIEAAVFLCASNRREVVPPFASGAAKDCRPHPLQIARFHREREKLYSILDPDERNAAFFRLHLEWFREWGLERPLTEMLQEFPLVRDQLGVLAVRKTVGKNDEGAELYINEAGQRTGLIALRLERLTNDAGLRNYLRHEFTHLHDMLDSSFGYSPTLELPGLNTAQIRLARERYRLLWDITIDGRLTIAGHTPMQNREQYAAAFARGYAFWPADRQAKTFDSLWRNIAPRHDGFLALIADPRGLRDAQRPAPGASCPLCDFPTFTWADGEALSPEIRVRINDEFPSWSPEQGLCGRCLETYQAAVIHNELPAQVTLG